jgi:hypothetical protein
MSELLTPELLEEATRSSGKLLELLEQKASRAGKKNPRQAAVEELSGMLTGVLERLAARYKNVKLGALEAVARLQKLTNAFYEQAITSKKPDIPRLERLLTDLDGALGNLEKGVGDVAAEGAESRPKTKPSGEVPRARKGDKLDARYKLSKKQRIFFRDWKKRAKGLANKLERDNELELMRHERNSAARRNRGDEPLSLEDYRNLVSKRNPSGNRKRGTAEAGNLRQAVGDYLKRKLTPGDSFTLPKGKTSKKFEITVTLDDGETVTTRPDGVTLDSKGRLAKKPILQEHKYWRGGGDGEIPETRQTRAQRQIARENGGQHVVSISADSPKLDAVPPKPRPSEALGENSKVVFVDRTTKKVTRVWSSAEQKWNVPK